MLKDGKDKLAKDGENKEATTFRCYSPQVDQVIEASTREEWEAKVQELLHAKSND